MTTSPSQLRAIKKWQKENRERKNQINNAYYQRHKDQIKERSRLAYQAKKYFRELPLIDSF